MIHYPFPSKENSMQDLVNDYVYSKIEPGKVEEIFDNSAGKNGFGTRISY